MNKKWTVDKNNLVSKGKNCAHLYFGEKIKGEINKTIVNGNVVYDGKKFYRETKGKIKIIGVGGVDSGESAFEKISAGADAVQLYTGMVYKGPGIVKQIKKDLISILKKENLKNISEAVGINA